jgi:adenylate cyclase
LTRAEAQKSTQSSAPDAIDVMMRGWAAIWQPLTKENTALARDYFERGLKIDPRSAEAMVGLAYARVRALYYGWNTSAEDERPAAQLALLTKATAIDPTYAFAFYVKSLALYFERQYSGSLEAARTGANLNPNSAFSFFGMGQAEIALSWPEAGPGHCEEGLLHIKEAFRLSPRDPLTGIWHMQSGLAQFCLERLDAATDEIRQGIDAGYRTFNIYGALASIEAIRGNESEAKAALAEALRLNPQLTIKRVEQIWKDRPPFFDGLRKAGLPEE